MTDLAANPCALTEVERELADRLCRSLAAKHAFGRRTTVELVTKDLRVTEVFLHLRIPRGHDEHPPALGGRATDS